MEEPPTTPNGMEKTQSAQLLEYTDSELREAEREGPNSIRRQSFNSNPDSTTDVTFSTESSSTKSRPTHRKPLNFRTWSFNQCVTVFAAFCCHFCIMAFPYTVGIYFDEFLVVFQKQAGETAWIGSLNFGTLCLAGPISGVMSDRFGCRMVVMGGGVIAATGLLLSAFANSLAYLYLTFGVITGLGLGLSFSATIFAVSLAFDQHRTFAMGITNSGVGVGNLVLPSLLEYLIHTYGWRGSLLLMSGLMLQTVILGALMKPEENQLDNFDKNTERCENVPKSKSKIIDTKIFCNFNYIALLFNVFLYCLGISVVIVHLPHLAHTLGSTHTQGSFLISVIGISTTAGRLVLGAVGGLRKVNVILLYSVSYGIAGLSTMFYTVSSQYSILVVCSVFYGFFNAPYGPLLPEVVMRIVGKKGFTAGYGIQNIFGGIGTMLGAPLAGWLYDGLHNYQPSFYLGGGALVLSGLVSLIPWKFEYCTRESNEDTEPTCPKKDIDI